MRLAGRLKLGFYPLPAKEAERIRARLQYPEEFAALDPCVGDGVAFSRLLESTTAHALGIEIDAFRAEHAGKLGIQVIQANAMDIRCPSSFPSGRTDRPSCAARMCSKAASCRALSVLGPAPHQSVDNRD